MDSREVCFKVVITTIYIIQEIESFILVVESFTFLRLKSVAYNYNLN